MKRVPVYMIAAVGRKGEIGKDNALIWRIPEDLRRFKALTWGNTVIMGRKTFLSIGRKLPGRFNIVLSRNPQFRAPGIWVRPSAESALALAGCFGKPVFVIGGRKVYESFLPLAEKLFLTEIDAEAPDADVYFPDFSPTRWEPIESVPPKEESIPAYRFVTYGRKKKNDT